MSEYLNIEVMTAFSVCSLVALIGVVIVAIKQVNVAFDSGYDAGNDAYEIGLIAAKNLSYKKGYAEGKNAGLLIGSCAQKSGPNLTKIPVKQQSKPITTRHTQSGQNKPKPASKKAVKGVKAK